MKRLLNRLFGKQTSPARTRKPRTVRLEVDQLEERLALSAISDLYASVGGPNGFLGAPSITERATPDGGREQYFGNGAIFWSPSSGGAHYLLNSPLLTEFQAQGGPAAFGYPTQNDSLQARTGFWVSQSGDLIDVIGGLPRSQVIRVDFKNNQTGAVASILDVRDRGAFAISNSKDGVWTGIQDNWQKLNRDLGAGRFVPVNDAHAVSGASNGATGQVQDFIDVSGWGPNGQVGNLPTAIYHTQYGTHYLGGNVLLKYRSLGELNYGLPTDDEHSVVNGKGEAVDLKTGQGGQYDGATIAWSALTGYGAAAIQGAIRDYWLRIGADRYEIPITDEGLRIAPATNSVERTLGFVQTAAYSWTENLTTGRLYVYDKPEDEGVHIYIQGVSRLRQSNTSRVYVPPVTVLPQATGLNDLLIQGTSVLVRPSDAGWLTVVVDGRQFQYAQGTVGNVFVHGGSVNTTLSVDDSRRPRSAAHAGPGRYVGYVVDKNHIGVNSLSIYYDTAVKKVNLWTSNLVVNSVDVESTRDDAPVDVVTSAMTYAVDAHFSSFNPFQTDPQTGVPILDHLTGTLSVYGNRNTTLNTFDDYTLNPSVAVDASSVREDGVAGQVVYYNVGGVQAHGNASASTLRVIASGPVPVTLVGGSGDATFAVGEISLDAIQGTVNVQGGTGRNVLTVTDALGSPGGVLNGKQYTVDEANIWAANATIHYSGINQVNLSTTLLDPSGTHVEVDGAAAGSALTIFANGNSSGVSVYFGASDGHQLLGDVTVVGTGNTGLDTRDLTGAHTFTLRDGSVTEEGRGTVSYSGITGLGVIGGNGDDTFRIEGTTAGVVTDVGGRLSFGNKTFIVGDEANSLDGIQGALNLHGSTTTTGASIYSYLPAYSTVVFHDELNPAAQTYYVTVAEPTGPYARYLPSVWHLTRTGLAPITFEKVASVALAGSTLAPATVQVEGVAKDSALSLALGAGSTVYVGRPLGGVGPNLPGIGTATLDAIKGDLYVNGINGSPTVVVDDSADTADQTLTAASTASGIELSGMAAGNLYFSQVDAADVQILPGGGLVTGLDDFFALLAAVNG